MLVDRNAARPRRKPFDLRHRKMHFFQPAILKDKKAGILDRGH